MSADQNQKPEPVDEDLSSLLVAGRMARLSSKNPLLVVKKNLMIQIVFGGLLCVFYLFLIIRFPVWPVRLCTGVVLLFTVWGIYTALQQLKRIRVTVSIDSPLMAELRRNLLSLRTWMRVQQRVALLVYPVSAAGGFMLGGILGSGKTVGIFMSKPAVLISLGLTILILVPICYWITRRMVWSYLGRHLESLEKNIGEMEEEK